MTNKDANAYFRQLCISRAFEKVDMPEFMQRAGYVPPSETEEIKPSPANKAIQVHDGKEFVDVAFDSLPLNKNIIIRIVKKEEHGASDN